MENLILWLGANNALGTVVTLKINQAPPDLNPPVHERGYLERQQRGWNLWHPDAFRAEYAELLGRIQRDYEEEQDHRTGTPSSARCRW